jgi:hypothetical protein
MLGRLQQPGDVLVRTNFPIDSLGPLSRAGVLPDSRVTPRDSMVLSSPERNHAGVTFTVTIPGRSAWTMVE